jgi:osmotically-inducible protein OsmY
MKLTHSIGGAAVALALVVAPTPALAATDAWITAKTKMALAVDDQASAYDVNVDTVDGVVTLHGKVDTAAEKTAAVKTAQGIEGVRSVVDLLQVVPPSKADATEESDDKIKERVTTALDTPDLEGSDIEVESVNAGVVLIGGEADSFTDHLQAVMLVAEVPGVRRVSSQVEAPPSPTDDELPRTQDAPSAAETAKDKLAAAGEAVGGAAKTTGEAIGDTAKKAGSATKEAGRDVAGVAKDMWITAATKTKLVANDETPALKINVDTHDGEVTLFGTVPSQEAKAEAEKTARSVDGVKAVHNELVVKSDDHAAATQ